MECEVCTCFHYIDRWTRIEISFTAEPQFPSVDWLCVAYWFRFQASSPFFISHLLLSYPIFPHSFIPPLMPFSFPSFLFFNSSSFPHSFHLHSHLISFSFPHHCFVHSIFIPISSNFHSHLISCSFLLHFPTRSIFIPLWFPRRPSHFHTFFTHTSTQPAFLLCTMFLVHSHLYTKSHPNNARNRLYCSVELVKFVFFCRCQKTADYSNWIPCENCLLFIWNVHFVRNGGAWNI